MLPIADETPQEGSRAGQVTVIGTSTPCLPLQGEMRVLKKQLSSSWPNRTRKPLCLKRRKPRRVPFFKSLASTAPLFPKADSVHIEKLQIVYMGKISCPHMRIYTSLRPKYLHLEIEQMGPRLTFCPLTEPLLMSAQLLRGMLPYVEPKHMLDISFGFYISVCSHALVYLDAHPACDNTIQATALPFLESRGCLQGLLFKAKVTFLCAT